MIEIENLSFHYGDNSILKELNAKIPKNSWVSILGHNGSGKSTLAKLLSGLLEIQQGTIAFDGIKLNETNVKALRPKIGMVFQNPDYQFIGLNVIEDIAFGLENQNINKKEIENRVFQTAKIVGIEHLLYQNVQKLSGGQKQLVAIAAVLAMETEVIIFDEITAFLDPQSTRKIKNVISQIKNKTLINITHDLSFALQSDQIIVLDRGKLIVQESPQILSLNDNFFHKYNLESPLALKLYYEMLKDDHTNQVKHYKLWKQLKEVLWQYNWKK